MISIMITIFQNLKSLLNSFKLFNKIYTNSLIFLALNKYGWFESTQREISNEYQHDKVTKVFKNLCILVLWTKVALALKELTKYLVKFLAFQKCIWLVGIDTWSSDHFG